MAPDSGPEPGFLLASSLAVKLGLFTSPADEVGLPPTFGIAGAGRIAMLVLLLAPLPLPAPDPEPVAGIQGTAGADIFLRNGEGTSSSLLRSYRGGGLVLGKIDDEGTIANVAVVAGGAVEVLVGPTRAFETDAARTCAEGLGGSFLDDESDALPELLFELAERELDLVCVFDAEELDGVRAARLSTLVFGARVLTSTADVGGVFALEVEGEGVSALIEFRFCNDLAVPSLLRRSPAGEGC